MSAFQIATILITLAAVFGYINHRYIRLPATIGVMLIALLMSLGLIVLQSVGFDLQTRAAALLASIDFNQTVMGGMLAFLLFAGALHVDLSDLAEQKLPVAVLATFGVVLSASIVGGLVWVLFWLLHLDVPLSYCFVFGALISPTDPIAVLGILKSIGVPKSLETKITGESLFNDGIGVVLFLVLLEFATGGHGEEPTARSIAALLAQEVLGGAGFGLVFGWIVYRMLKSVDNYQVEILLTLALVMGTYALATALHLSGPIAIVVAGLLIGNHGRALAMSQRTREHLDTFWELVDEILNAVLFVLIGLEVLVLTFTREYVLAGVLAIPIVLLARLVSVSISVTVLRRFRVFSPRVIRILTWGGLRGGISVALALALPRGGEREVLVAVTYAIVLFSIIVQGLTIGGVIRRSVAAPI
jgi:CPA1 family monovalent cation:H+ antiporter